jgi:hypothetical protein
MNREQELVTVSTDVLGFVANPWEVQTLYQEAGFRCDLEIVAMPIQYSVLCALSKSKCNGLDIGGIHGQLGHDRTLPKNTGQIMEHLKVAAADLLLPKIMGWNKLITPFPIGTRIDMIADVLGKEIYFNVHRSIAETDFKDYLDYGTIAKKSHLTIENGSYPSDMQKTKDLIHKFHDHGIKKTTGTFDLVHSIKAETDNQIDFAGVKWAWNKVLGQLNQDFKYLHIPIGSNNDSLPIIEMLKEKTMLKDLSEVVRELNLHITIENQHGLLFGADKNEECERLKEIRSGLRQAGMNI